MTIARLYNNYTIKNNNNIIGLNTKNTYLNNIINSMLIYDYTQRPTVKLLLKYLMNNPIFIRLPSSNNNNLEIPFVQSLLWLNETTKNINNNNMYTPTEVLTKSNNLYTPTEILTNPNNLNRI